MDGAEAQDYPDPCVSHVTHTRGSSDGGTGRVSVGPGVDVREVVGALADDGAVAHVHDEAQLLRLECEVEPLLPRTRGRHGVVL